MKQEIVAISPEGMEVANNYLTMGSIDGVCSVMAVSREKVVEVLESREVKRYIDICYLDSGYRNRNNIASLLDEMIASKLIEAQESGIYSNKDLADLLQMAHKMRMDEIKMEIEREKNSTNIKNQSIVQINDTAGFGEGKYGELMSKLLTST
jgi:molybdenum cofactor biosynthesis enzyme